MAYGKIDLERDGDIAIIRLNDPATLNAVTVQTIEEIDQALDEIKGSARAMILTGAGRVSARARTCRPAWAIASPMALTILARYSRAISIP